MTGCQEPEEKLQRWRKVKPSLSKFEGIEGQRLGDEGFVVERLRRGDRSLVGKPRSGIPMKHQGYAVMDLETGKVLSSHQDEKTFVPASTIKLFTAVAAMSILGPDHRFRTTLAYDGRIEGEVLKGDLYLRGEGDPFLTAAQLMSFVEALRRLGIRRVEGDFFYDESRFVVRKSLVGPELVGVPYNMGVGPLSVEFNQFKVAWNKRTSKKAFRIYSVPDLDLFHFGRSSRRFESETGFRKTAGHFDGHQYWMIDPKRSSRGGRTRLPSSQPGMYTAEFFRELCMIGGILLPHSKSGTMNTAAVRIVKENYGKPVVELVESVFEYSNNLIAELLLLGAAAELSRTRITSVAEAGRRVKGWLKDNIKTVKDWSGFELVRGSGLTAENRMSPAQVLGLLQYANRQNYSGRSFLSLLPISGWKGTLSRRLKDPDGAFHVWAKTGTLQYSSSIVGYLFSKRGRKLAFALLSTHHREMRSLASEPDRGKGWRSRAIGFQNEMMNHWIQSY